MTSSETLVQQKLTPEKRMQQALLAARQRRLDYRTAIGELQASAEFLQDSIISITGVLTGRKGGSVARDSPAANVEALHVKVWKADVVDYEHAERVPRDLIPFVKIVASTIESNEMVCGNLIPGGIAAEIIETRALDI